MRLNEKLVQTLAYLRLMKPDKVGFYKGPLSSQRQKKHSQLSRPYHISIIGGTHYRRDLALLTVFSINEHCQDVSANLNTVTDKTDAIWILLQDPIDEARRVELEQKCKTDWASKLILNSPETYNIYHSDTCFPILDKAGVSVPNYEFTDDDLGKTKVIYKKINQQTSEKFICEYKGPVEGYRPFQFIDTIDQDVYHRYRAFYVLGNVIPTIYIQSPSWNVCHKHETFRKIGFDLTQFEIDQLSLIAKALDMDYFAVDFIRANNTSYFIDVNIYPTVKHRSFTGKQPYGLFHTFNFLKDLNGTPVWESFERSLIKRIQDERS
jgi:hypothetical protein